MSYDNCPFCKTAGTVNDERYEDDGDFGSFTWEYFCPNCQAEWDATEPWTKSYETIVIDIIESPDKNNIEFYREKKEE